MKIVQSVKMAVTSAFLIASILGQPLLAHAEEGSTRNGGGGDIIVFDIVGVVDSPTSSTDDVIVDGNIITAENTDTAGGSSDPEWRYVPVRRTANADTANAEGGTTKGNGGGGVDVVFDING